MNTLSQAMAVYEAVSGTRQDLTVGFYPAYQNALGVVKDPLIVVAPREHHDQPQWTSGLEAHPRLHRTGSGPFGGAPVGAGFGGNPFTDRPEELPLGRPAGFGAFGRPQPAPRLDTLAQTVARVLAATSPDEAYFPPAVSGDAAKPLWLDTISREILQQRIEAEQAALAARKNKAHLKDFFAEDDFQDALAINARRADNRVPGTIDWLLQADSAAGDALVADWQQRFSALAVTPTAADERRGIEAGRPAVLFEAEGYRGTLSQTEAGLRLVLTDAYAVYRDWDLGDWLENTHESVQRTRDGGILFGGADYDDDEDDDY